MKILSTLTLAALLSTGAAFAANTAPTATPAGTATPASTSAAKHHSMAYCEKQAKGKNLAGDAEKSFVKDCRAGKKTD